MTRLIDADALSEKLCETTIFIKDGEVFQRMINDTPTIDAEPVVRCEDCIFYEKALSVQGFCHNHASIVHANGFCSYGSCGEHREDDKA